MLCGISSETCVFCTEQSSLLQRWYWCTPLSELTPRLTHLQSVLAGTVASGKRSPHDAHHTAHSDDLASLPLDHVVQDILGQWDGAQVVELNDGTVDIQVCVHEQGALRAPTIVDQNINLRKDTKIKSYKHHFLSYLCSLRQFSECLALGKDQWLFVCGWKQKQATEGIKVQVLFGKFNTENEGTRRHCWIYHTVKSKRNMNINAGLGDKEKV